MPQPRSRLRSALLVPLLVLALVPAFAPAAAAHELTCTPPAEVAVEEAPLDLPAYRARLEAYFYSGEYEEDIAEVVAEAREFLEERLEAGVERPAIVLDVDETSLSNWSQLKTMQFGYSSLLWHKWVEEASAYAIGPVLGLARWAHEHDVALFFITGRSEGERAATERNLEAVGFAPWHTLYLEDESICCRAEACDFAATCKAYYRKKISDQGFTVVANLGDQRSDLLGGWAERSFKIPNPFYFIP